MFFCILGNICIMHQNILKLIARQRLSIHCSIRYFVYVMSLSVLCMVCFIFTIIYFSDHETSGRISDQSIEWNGRQDFPDLPDNWIDFSRRKKGPIRKENSVLCTTSFYDFPFFTIINKHPIQTVSNTKSSALMFNDMATWEQ